MELRTRKRLTYVVTSIYFLLGGAEFAVILPTLYPYVKSLHGDEFFYGVTLAAFCISSLFANPVFGHVVDRMKKTKSLVLVTNMFQIGGNFMYFVGTSKYMLLGGRLVTGIGMGGGVAIYAQLAWMSTEEERTAVMSIAMACRQFGILAGPALNIFLKEINFQIGPFNVNQLSVPGLFLAVLWCVMQLVVIVMYFDLPPVQEVTVSDEASTADNVNISKSAQDGSGFGYQFNDICSNDSDSDVMPLLSTKASKYQTITTCTDRESISQQHSIRRRLTSITDEYLREEIVVLLGIIFIIFFNQLVLESVIVPFSTKYFGWSAVDNSYFYCGSAGLAMSAYVTIQRVSKRVPDRWIMAIGLVFGTSGVCLLTIFTPQMTPLHDITRNTVIVMFASAFLTLGFPCALTTSTSLISKLTSMKMQGVTQAIRRIVSNFGIIMGPLWSSAFFGMLNIMCGVMLGLQIMILAMVILSFRKLKEKSFLKQNKDED